EKAKVLRIEDEDGNEMESCPHAKQRIRVFLSVLPDNGDILRILNDTETV
ncbi:MAG: U32 family peptidase C-terminal domain-containing protein, partial [Lachnospiraceae bacterium]|nr:U32 family peptidase C-terminal domain-containing protein [Lachnospiraceae bacterium]